MIEAEGSRVLVDCGLYQGPDADRRNAEPFAFSPAGLDAVVLTHAHIDHSGRLPLLVKHGFRGRICCTDPTADLVSVLLQDTVRLMAEEAEWKSRKNARKGLPPLKPLFGENDVKETLARLRPVSYDDRTEIAPGFSARYRDAGHIVGAAIIELWLGNGRTTKVVFSGDLGPMHTVIEKTPTLIEGADYVVIESTYGDRAHKGLDETRAEFQEQLGLAMRERAKILVPTFVVDRAQRVLYELLLLQRSGKFTGIPPIFFDSPMGGKTTRIYEKYIGLLSRTMKDSVRAGQNPFEPDGLSYTASVEESRAINEIPHAIVLAGSGMCTGGRIVHHLKHNLWQRSCHVFFVGYQAQGTLGRRLVNGEKNLRIAGEDVTVEAQLHTLGGFSAHGDRNDLLDWAQHFPRNAVFFVTHGEPKSSQSLASGLRDMGYSATAPSAGMSFDLLEGDAVMETQPGTVQRPIMDRQQVLALLHEITSETEAVREKLDSLGDYSSLLPLLESSRLILQSAKNMK